MTLESMKNKSQSVSSDTYDQLAMDNQAYINMSAGPQDNSYISPTSNDLKPATHPGPRPPPRDFGTPPPPKRDVSVASATGSEDAFTGLSVSMPDVTKNKATYNNNISHNGSKTRVFRKEPMSPSTPMEQNGKEKILFKQKNAAFDSGVGDLEQIHIDGSHAKTYDYADYGHQYEELPNRRSIAKCAMDSGIDSRSELYQSSGGATDIASEAGDMANIVNHNEKRKRVNPLYDANMTQSMPSIYNKTKTGNDKSLLRQVRCLKCGLIILLVVSIASLAISLFAVINYMQTKDEIDPVLAPRVDALHDNYIRLQQLLSSFDDNNDTMKVLSELIKKVNVIKTNASTQAGEIDQLWQQAYTQSQHINKNANNILASRDNMTNMIASLNLTLQLQLHNISKQEGPMGPQGVANFTRCRMLNISNDAVASEVFSSYTRWSPLEIELESHIAIFSMCSVDGGVDSRLKIQTLGAQEDLQYQCECSGVINGKSRRICYIHQLICPRVS